jgi:4-hydroxybenzoate polyprenyltransferase
MIQVGYILTALFSVVLNDTEQIPWQTFIYLTFFCFKAHLTGEIMDIIPDRLANKKTTASLLGAQKAKLLLLVFLIIETSILIYWFEAYLLAAALGAFAVWIVLDAFVIYKNRSYILKEMKLFGYLMNAVGFGSMIWILWTGKLMTTI